MCDILAGLSGYCHDSALICYQPIFLSQPLHWLITISDRKSILLMRRLATTGWPWPLCGFITRNSFSYIYIYQRIKWIFTDWGGRIVCSSASRLRKGPASVSGPWAEQHQSLYCLSPHLSATLCHFIKSQYIYPDEQYGVYWKDHGLYGSVPTNGIPSYLCRNKYS